MASADGIYLRYSVTLSQRLIKLVPASERCALEWDRALYEPYGPHGVSLAWDGGVVVAAGRQSGNSMQQQEGWRVVEFPEEHFEY